MRFVNGIRKNQIETPVAHPTEVLTTKVLLLKAGTKTKIDKIQGKKEGVSGKVSFPNLRMEGKYG